MIPLKLPLLWSFLWICMTIILQDLYVGVKHIFALWEECQKLREQSVYDNIWTWERCSKWAVQDITWQVTVWFIQITKLERVVKPVRLWLARRVAWMWSIQNFYRETSWGDSHLEDWERRWENNIQVHLREMDFEDESWMLEHGISGVEIWVLQLWWLLLPEVECLFYICISDTVTFRRILFLFL